MYTRRTIAFALVLAFLLTIIIVDSKRGVQLDMDASPSINALVSDSEMLDILKDGTQSPQEQELLEELSKNEAVMPLEVTVEQIVRDYLSSTHPDSPMITEIDYIFSIIPESKAIKLLAIAGTESEFGTKGYVATNCNNPFGYLYYGTSKRGCYSPKWDTYHNAITRFVELEEHGWLATDDYSGYCVTGCEHWADNYNYFINLFTN